MPQQDVVHMLRILQAVPVLRAAGQPARRVLEPEKKNEGAKVDLTLAPNAVVRLRLLPVEKSSDPGYDYGWYCKE